MRIFPRTNPPPLSRYIHVFSPDQRTVWRAVCCARVRVGGLGPQELAAVEALDGRGRCISPDEALDWRKPEFQDPRTLRLSAGSARRQSGDDEAGVFYFFHPEKMLAVASKAGSLLFQGDFPARFISCR